MTDSSENISTAETIAQPAWPLRPLLLALLGLATGILVSFLAGETSRMGDLQRATLVFVVTPAVLIAFTLERRRWQASLLFSLAWGLVAALIFYDMQHSHDNYGDGDPRRVFSLLVAIMISTPLFQAGYEQGPSRPRYATVYNRVWTNTLLWCACWVFVAIVFALAWLLAALFHLIGLDFISRLLRQDLVWRGLIGLAFGAAAGLLYEQILIVRLVQRAVATALAMLTPILAAGLALFLLMLPFTGLATLWEATRSTTPVLLGCVIGALILINIAIGDGPEQEVRAPVLRYAAMVLGAAILPLATLAAISTGLRIHQYGLSPERLWAVTLVTLACGCGIVYFACLIYGRLDWARLIRSANLALAFILCPIALLLATPLPHFDAIATRDQLARLESGRIAPDKFDWNALAYRYGEPGKAALKRLQASPNPQIAVLAKDAGNRAIDDAPPGVALDQRLRILPAGTPLPAGLRDQIDSASSNCTATQRCTLWFPGPDEALLFDDCFQPSANCAPRLQRYRKQDGQWNHFDVYSELSEADWEAIRKGYSEGKIEVRTVTARQVYVGGKPVGQLFR